MSEKDDEPYRRAEMGIRAGSFAHFIHVPPDVRDSLGLPELEVDSKLQGQFDYLHLFVKHQTELDETLPHLKKHLAPAGALWVSWPKGRREGTDLVLSDVIRIAYDHKFVESTALSVNEVWSALKLTHPKPGKVYRNSYGKLPEESPISQKPLSDYCRSGGNNDES